MSRHSNAYIWLQDEEEEGIANCGCRLIADEEGPRFIMCGLHSAAMELRTALWAAWNFIENVTDDDPDRSDKFFEARAKMRDAISLSTKGD